jgi:dolichyl-phosphate-mannose-protein mannosyltransferase
MATNEKASAHSHKAALAKTNKVPPNGTTVQTPSRTLRKTIGYQSDGVNDNDIFELPGSDWQILGLLTIVATFVRLFRIYQPTSVVFDEVQYVVGQPG